MTNHDLDEEIEIVPFNLAWKEIFNQEAEAIQTKLGKEIICIEHIGSTSIPNILSKPIIDIMLGVENLEKTASIIKKLKDLGYQYFGTANVPGRLYLRKRSKNNFNVAICEYKSAIWNNNILFRDFLLANPDEAIAYSNHKKEIFQSGVMTLLEYSDKKHIYVTEILKKAKTNR